MGSAAGVMQILFMMEDQYGLTIDVIQSRLCLVFDTSHLVMCPMGRHFCFRIKIRVDRKLQPKWAIIINTRLAVLC